MNRENNQLLWCTLFLHSLVRNHVMIGKCAMDCFCCLCLSHTALLICKACWGFVSGIFHSLKRNLQDALNQSHGMREGVFIRMSPRTSQSHHPDICSDSERHCFCLDRSRITIPHHGPLGILLPVRSAPERLPRRVQAVCVFFRVRVPVHRALGGGGFFSPHSIFLCRIRQCYILTSSRLLKGSKLL